MWMIIIRKKLFKRLLNIILLNFNLFFIIFSLEFILQYYKRIGNNLILLIIIYNNLNIIKNKLCYNKKIHKCITFCLNFSLIVIQGGLYVYLSDNNYSSNTIDFNWKNDFRGYLIFEIIYL